MLPRDYLIALAIFLTWYYLDPDVKKML